MPSTQWGTSSPLAKRRGFRNMGEKRRESKRNRQHPFTRLLVRTVKTVNAASMRTNTTPGWTLQAFAEPCRALSGLVGARRTVPGALGAADPRATLCVNQTKRPLK